MGPMSTANESSTTLNGPYNSDFNVTNMHTHKSSSIDDPLTPRDEGLFLSWHLKLGHTPFCIIQWAAKLGLLPSKLQHCQNVKCPVCLYGKQKRRPWQTKNQPQSSIKKSQHPEQFVSVDQLVSHLPGLVGQTTGRLTTSRYKVSTIFVDHFSDLDYVHVQESTSASDTIEAKQAFERFADARVIQICHYHADNGIFASMAFAKKCRNVVKQSPSVV